MNKGILMIQERNGHRYGYLKNVHDEPRIENYRRMQMEDMKRRSRSSAAEDVEVLTAVNQTRAKQRHRESLAATQEKKDARHRSAAKAVCWCLDAIAYMLCLIASVLFIYAELPLIAMGVIAMGLAYTIFTSRLD